MLSPYLFPKFLLFQHSYVWTLFLEDGHLWPKNSSHYFIHWKQVRKYLQQIYNSLLWISFAILCKMFKVVLFLCYHIFYVVNICISRNRFVFGYGSVSKSFVHWLSRYEPAFIGWPPCPMLLYPWGLTCSYAPKQIWLTANISIGKAWRYRPSIHFMKVVTFKSLTLIYIFKIS